MRLIPYPRHFQGPCASEKLVTVRLRMEYVNGLRPHAAHRSRLLVHPEYP